MKALKKIVALSALFAPALVFAALDTTSGNIGFIVNLIGDIANFVVPILVTIALAYFIYGVVKYIAGGEESRKQAKDIIIYGIVGLFAIVSVWGLIKLIQKSAGIDVTNTGITPALPKP